MWIGRCRGRRGHRQADDHPHAGDRPILDRAGRCGVYNSSFLLHAERAGVRYGVSAHEILQRVGEAGYVGGQEDMIIDIALQIAQERDMGDMPAAGVR